MFDPFEVSKEVVRTVLKQRELDQNPFNEAKPEKRGFRDKVCSGTCVP